MVSLLLLLSGLARAEEPAPLPPRVALPSWGVEGVNRASRTGLVLGRVGRGVGLTSAGLAATGTGILLVANAGRFDSTAYSLGIGGLVTGGLGAYAAVPFLTAAPLVTARGLRQAGVPVANGPGILGVGLSTASLATGGVLLFLPWESETLIPVGISLSVGSLIAAGVQSGINHRGMRLLVNPTGLELVGGF